jgi:8-oxo-dGTP pyrophosphatase MutT (NUDIX family)
MERKIQCYGLTVVSLRITAAELRAALAGGGRPLDAGPIDVSGARPAAVAVPVALSPAPVVYLVLRGSHLTDHTGEIAFPGGKADAADASLRATAAREMHEEVGVHERDVEWLGELSPIPVITGRYVIHPFVGLLAEGAEPRVASGEIVEVLKLPILPYLSGEERVKGMMVEWRGARMLAPHFPVGGRVLYGATAYVTYELLAKLAATMGHMLPPPELTDEAPWADRYR